MILKNLVIFLLGSVFFITMGFNKYAYSESYIGASIGAALSSDAEDIDIVEGAATANLTDLDTDGAFAYGIKVGHYFNSVPWLGVEFNFSQADPDVGKQTTTLSGTAAGIAGAATGQFQVDVNHVTTYGFLAMLRATEEQTKNMFDIQPYFGVGVAINNISLGRATAFNTAGAELAGGAANLGSDTSLGLLLSAGLNYDIDEHISAYGEYKFTQIDFEDTTGGSKYDFELDVSSLMFGIAYNF